MIAEHDVRHFIAHHSNILRAFTTNKRRTRRIFAGSVRLCARRVRIMKLSENIFISLAARCNGKMRSSRAELGYARHMNERDDKAKREAPKISYSWLPSDVVRMVRAAPILQRQRKDVFSS